MKEASFFYFKWYLGLMQVGLLHTKFLINFYIFLKKFKRKNGIMMSEFRLINWNLYTIITQILYKVSF
jgi:hypothetical protein